MATTIDGPRAVEARSHGCRRPGADRDPQDQLYVFTHAGAAWRAELRERFDMILTAVDEAAADGR
jgi:hypothetical protein